MALTPRLELRLSQTLVMTPQLQQSIKLLQLSNPELASYVDIELEQNPLLEHDEQDKDNQREAGREIVTESEPAEHLDAPEAPDTAELTVAETLPSEGDSPLDDDFENVHESDDVIDIYGRSQTAFASDCSRGGSFDSEHNFESALSQKLTLRDHLNEQLNLDIEHPVDRMIGVH